MAADSHYCLQHIKIEYYKVESTIDIRCRNNENQNTKVRNDDASLKTAMLWPCNGSSVSFGPHLSQLHKSPNQVPMARLRARHVLRESKSGEGGEVKMSRAAVYTTSATWRLLVGLVAALPS